MNNPQLHILSDHDRRAVFERTESALGIKAHMVEKDAWVCWVLGQLFALPAAREHFIFKGGTSLSKAWKIIERFSEDIDISLSREWLGFSGARDPESAPSRKQRSRLLDDLTAVCVDKLKEVVAPALRQGFVSALGSMTWSLEIDPADPQTLLFAYPSVFQNASGAGYVRPVVKIECGARSDRWPVAERSIAPYIAEAFPSAFPAATVSIPVLGVERTFWEKATILHAEAHRPADKDTPERFSRHYSDLAAFVRHPQIEAAAVLRDDLRARVVAHKQVFFPAAWARYETAVPGTFKLIPSDHRLQILASDYEAMQDMFFRSPMTWPEVLMRLRTLEAQINKT